MGSDKRKRNHNIVDKNATVSLAHHHNKKEIKKIVDDQPTTTTANLSDLSIYINPKNQTNKISHKLNYPNNLSTILPPKSIKTTIPKLKLPSVTNNNYLSTKSNNNSSSNRTNNSSRVALPSFRFSQKNNSSDLSFIKKSDLIIFGSPNIHNKKPPLKGCLSPQVVDYSRNNKANYNKRTIKFCGFSDYSSSVSKTDRKEQNLTFIKENEKKGEKPKNINKITLDDLLQMSKENKNAKKGISKNSSQLHFAKILQTVKSLQIIDKKLNKKPSSTEKVKPKSKGKFKLFGNIIPKRNFHYRKIIKPKIIKSIDKEPANPVQSELNLLNSTIKNESHLSNSSESFDDESFNENEKEELVKITEEERKEEGAERFYNEIKKERKRTHSSITFYSIVSFTKQEKHFLKGLCPKQLPTKSTLSPNYSNFLALSIEFVTQKVKKKLAPPRKERIINFKPKMFLNSKAETFSDSTHFEDEILIKLRNFFYVQYQNNKLNLGLANHVMNEYLEMSPEIISDFILGIEKNKKRKLKRQNAMVNLKGKKSCYSEEKLDEFKKMLSVRENLLFFQKSIFKDHLINQCLLHNAIKVRKTKSTLINGEYISDSSSSDEIKEKINHDYTNDEDEFYSTLEIKHKKRRANLNLLQHDRIFKKENQNRTTEFQTNQYLRYTKGKVDETLNSLLHEIHMLQNKDIINSTFRSLVFQLLKHCILYFEEELFFQFFTKYREVIDINLADQDNNTLLILATKINSTRITKFLLYQGADTDKVNKYGNSAMHYAVAGKYYEVTDLLRKFNAREDLQNNDGKLPWECVNGCCEEG